jgi:uncharacterized protein YbjT (DUF2867 family)
MAACTQTCSLVLRPATRLGHHGRCVKRRGINPGTRRVVVPNAASTEATAEGDATTTSTACKKTHSIVVFGANGKTGKRCVSTAARAGATVVACTRAGDFNANEFGLQSELVNQITPKQGDVSKASDAQINEIVKGASAVVFAASASQSGGTPEQVDKNGLIKVARACIAQNVKRLVVVSSGSVSKPLSPVYVFLNFFGGVMRAKIEGEDAIRRMYVSRENCAYVIMRPGGLTEDPGRGASAMELNQGDEKSGRVSREDVAALCVAAAMSEESVAKNATFECYWSDTANDLSDVGVSNMLGAFSGDQDAKDKKTGKERRGDTWVDLLAGLESDVPGEAQQGWGPSL